MLYVFSFQAFNWMLHNVTQPMCLQDLMWWFVDAMNKNPENMKKKLEKPEVFDISIEDAKCMGLFV